MNSARILSQQGNVIAADFRPRHSADISVRLTAETLYCDGYVLLIRFAGSIEGKPAFAIHILGDLATGRVINL